jgi:hypothetical protein
MSRRTGYSPRPAPTQAFDGRDIKVIVGDLGDGTFLVCVFLGHGCNDDHGRLTPGAERVLTALPAHAEHVPSGTGLAAIFHCRAERVRAFLDRLAGCRVHVGFSLAAQAWGQPAA